MLLSLVNDILDLARLENNVFLVNEEEFALNDFLEEIYMLFRFQCEMKGIEI